MGTDTLRTTGVNSHGAHSESMVSFSRAERTLLLYQYASLLCLGHSNLISLPEKMINSLKAGITIYS